MKLKNVLICVTAFMTYVAHGMDTHINMGPASLWQAVRQNYQMGKLKEYPASPATIALAHGYLTALNHPDPASVKVKMCNKEYHPGAYAFYDSPTNTIFLKNENFNPQEISQGQPLLTDVTYRDSQTNTTYIRTASLSVNHLQIYNKITLAHECGHAVHESNCHNTDRAFIRNYVAAVYVGSILGYAWGMYNSSLKTIMSVAAFQAFALSIERPIFNKFVSQPRELRAEADGLRALIKTGDKETALHAWRNTEPMTRNPKTDLFYAAKPESFWRNWGVHPTKATVYWAMKPVIEEYCPEIR